MLRDSLFDPIALHLERQTLNTLKRLKFRTTFPYREANNRLSYPTEITLLNFFNQLQKQPFRIASFAILISSFGLAIMFLEVGKRVKVEWARDFFGYLG